MLINLFLVAAALALLVPQAKQESGTTTWTNPAEVHVPPPGWNPLKATDEELNYYNFPPRPEDAELLKEWEKIVTSGHWEPARFEPSGFGSTSIPKPRTLP
jgi:hypothetical protein